mgnify:CR=1 FL=1
MKFMYSLLIIIEIVLMGICAVKSFGKKGKLSTRYVGPYNILGCYGNVAYDLAIQFFSRY